MPHIAAERILTVSHAPDPLEVAQKLDEACFLGVSNYQSLILRRLDFDESICKSLRNVFRSKKRRNRLWEKVELRWLSGDPSLGLTTCLELDVIQELQLVLNNQDIPEKSWEALADALIVSKNLRSLHISTAFGKQGLCILSRGLLHPDATLRVLDLSWGNFESNDAVEALASGLTENRSLEEVKIIRSSLTDNQASLIVNAVKIHPKLRVLDLHGNHCGTQASQALGDLLENNTSLTDLCLSFQAPESRRQPSNGSRINLHCLTRGLSKNQNLRRVDLSDCGLNNDDIQLLAALLSQREAKIEELFVHRNSISDTGIIVFAKKLPCMRSLRRISLWGNPFEKEGGKALLEGAKRNFFLQQVDLFREFEAFEEMALYMALNKAGRRLLQTHDDRDMSVTKLSAVPLGLWARVLARADRSTFPSRTTVSNLDLIQHLLLGPALFHSR